MTNLENIIDAYGDLKGEIDALEEQLEEMKADLKQLGEGKHLGKRYLLTINDHQRKVLDQKAAREALGEQWTEEHTTLVPYRTMLCKVRKQLDPVD